ncbi:hypothetical protein BJ875DRAFT_487689 [Amylocarpus encephaloides]|uniref:Glycoside hydrolase family 2 protein n=1 Tax=Amylocarpus encephaloides TaxID=45428 RepID=A0A9P7YCS2_9HELO|nr:hypothetical protein BJ875DRAFT_487689 [Amylocarpus encephaloides]
MDYLSTIANSALQRKDKMAGHPSNPKKANPLTYPKSAEPFSPELFRHPTSEYRGCPLWAWNTKLEKGQLLRQIDNFAEMGLGGFHIHVRIGLDTEYLGTEFMDLVKECVDYAESKNLMACLYDEDRWPSGAAGGLVVKKYPEHKGKHLLFTPHPYGTVPLLPDGGPSSARGTRSENGHLLARYNIALDENGCLKSSRILEEEETGNNVWYVYEESNPGSPWYNDQTYVDSLSEEAIGKFIEMTHEVYKANVGDRFGSVVPCIFTDEPQFATKTKLSNPRAAEDVFMPWTPDLPKTFKKEYSTDLIKDIPQLVWDLPDGDPSTARYRFHDHVCERFATSFMDQIAKWCKKNGIMLNGHMMEEPTLQSQTSAIGEAMRCYRNMEMPGMDLLCDFTEYNTAKQVASVARQNGLRGAMCEIYGVTHWTFTFQDHKGCGDWQAALGITFRVQHLTWLSMSGEGKRDYPASIGYQSPWYKEYGHVEDHFARVGVVMTRGKAVTEVAVIHPIESYWMAYGPDGSGNEREERDSAFGDLTQWLLHALIDFDFIAESLLPGQVASKASGKKLKVGACEYSVVVVPNLRTIRSTTLKVLRDFSKAGGKVIFAGSSPDLVDAQVPASNPTVKNSQSIFWNQQNILSALDQYRDIRIFTDQGTPVDNMLYQMREEGNIRFVFVVNRDRWSPVQSVIKLKGNWNIEELNTITGVESNLVSAFVDGWTTFPYRFEGCASLIIRLSPSSTKEASPRTAVTLLAPQPKNEVQDTDLTLESLELSEPNVLLLDYAEYKVDDQDWIQAEEVLRIDNILRDRFHIPRKGSAWKQPWSVPPEDRVAKCDLSLRFTFESSFDILEFTSLALEDATKIKVTINDYPIDSSDTERPYWVDEAITTLEIPQNIIKNGQNTLVLSMSYGLLTNLERIYLLGAFAVSLSGRTGVLKRLHPGLLTWGNIADQGFPFYVGNVTYNCSFIIPSVASWAKTSTTLRVPNFSSPVLTVATITTRTRIGTIAFQPRTLSLGSLPPGEHQIAITAYGNRYNSFGHIHVPGYINLCWPDMWRTGGDWWTEAYALRVVGVIDCPIIETTAASENDATESKQDEDGWVVVKTND